MPLSLLSFNQYTKHKNKSKNFDPLNNTIVTQIIDFLIGYSAGKNILCIYKKDNKKNQKKNVKVI